MYFQMLIFLNAPASKIRLATRLHLVCCTRPASTLEEEAWLATFSNSITQSLLLAGRMIKRT